MSGAELTILVPAIVGLLTALTALIRWRMRQPSSSPTDPPAPDVPCSHDQSCPPGGH